MSYIDDLLTEVDQKASSIKPEMVASLFDKISSSMVGVTSMKSYIQLKKDLKFIERMHEAIAYDGEMAQNDQLVYLYVKMCQRLQERQDQLATIKRNSRGIRRLKREILESVAGEEPFTYSYREYLNAKTK